MAVSKDPVEVLALCTDPEGGAGDKLFHYLRNQ